MFCIKLFLFLRRLIGGGLVILKINLSNMQIKEATTTDIESIIEIAQNTWFEAYKNILSEEQIEYMLTMMYSQEALKSQMENQNHVFLLVGNDNINGYQGFVSYELNYKDSNKAKLHKLYVLPENQGLGIGRILINKVCETAAKSGNQSVLLNMNRYNKALDFYTRMGFEIKAEENIDIGNGYWMEDYVMENSQIQS